MSLEKEVKENCPHCDKEQILSYYNSVNVTLDPSLKAKVLQGELNSQSCTYCEKNINIMGGFLYHDMKNRLMINLKLDEDIDELSKSEILKELKEGGYIYRNVKAYPELVEKIKLFDLRINDEVIDKVKLELIAMLSSSLEAVVGKTEDSEINIFFDGIEKRLFSKKLSFIFFLHPSQIMKVQYSLKKIKGEDKQKLFDLDILRS